MAGGIIVTEGLHEVIIDRNDDWIHDPLVELQIKRRYQEEYVLVELTEREALAAIQMIQSVLMCMPANHSKE